MLQIGAWHRAALKPPQGDSPGRGVRQCILICSIGGGLPAVRRGPGEVSPQVAVLRAAGPRGARDALGRGALPATEITTATSAAVLECVDRCDSWRTKLDLDDRQVSELARILSDLKTERAAGTTSTIWLSLALATRSPTRRSTEPKVSRSGRCACARGTLRDALVTQASACTRCSRPGSAREVIRTPDSGPACSRSPLAGASCRVRRAAPAGVCAYLRRCR